MRDLTRKVVEARDAVQLQWSPEREAALELSTRRRARRRARARIAAGALAGIAAIALSIRFVPTRSGSSIQAAPPIAAWETLPDGSRVLRGSRDTRFDVQRSAGAVTVHLFGGRATFDVVHRPERLFRVEAGSTAVLVLGTTFTVERTESRAIVSVASGRVRVLAPERSADLAEGDSIALPIGDDVHPARDSNVTAEGEVTPTTNVRAVAHEPARDRVARPALRETPQAIEPDWRTLANRGDFDRAYAAIATEPSRAVNDSPADLLLAADSARLSHHPSEAVPYLRNVVERHASDARAPLAAFALGRVLLDDLGNPREAADAFARAQRLDPNGSLVEDALAREVEALSRAGDASAAREAAQRYVDRFPRGRRLEAVRRFGGLAS